MKRLLTFALLTFALLTFALVVCAQIALAQNAALMPVPKLQFLDASGAPLAGGYLYTCLAGQSCTPTLPGRPALNPLATYTDASGTVANANPIVLDSAGRANVWLGKNLYKIVVQDFNGVTQFSQDNVNAPALALSGSLAGANGAGLVIYTAAGTGAVSRTLAAIHGDMIDAANYDTITHAFADACATTPGKLVYIPATIAGSQTYTNSCGAPVYDTRIGTSGAPASSRSFFAPLMGGTVYDASPLTTNSASQGDGSYAPIQSIRVFETGGANAAALYTEYHAGAGATGAAYGIAANVSADPGSNVPVVAHNWTIQDASHYWITGCSRTSNVATCTTNGNPSVALLNSSGSTACVYVTGTVDTSFQNANFVICPTSFTTTSITYANSGADTTSGAGGWISPSHQYFGFELNLNNSNHDPGHLTPVSGQNTLPVWGFVSTNTPFSWTNPTGGAAITNQPISAGFFASAGGTSNAGQYIGFLAQNAIDDMFVAGYPIIGGSVSPAKSGFRARPTAVATATTNYPSQKSCWDKSVWNGVQYAESSFCQQYVPAAGTNASGTFNFIPPSGQWFQISDNGTTLAQNGSVTQPAYGFVNAVTMGMYTDGNLQFAVNGTNPLTVGQGQINANVVLNAKSGLQANGTAGATTTVACGAGLHISGITVVGGIITAVGPCN